LKTWASGTKLDRESLYDADLAIITEREIRNRLEKFDVDLNSRRPTINAAAGRDARSKP
jgi:hypothetical protein